MNSGYLKPILGFRSGSSNDRFLLVCYYDPNGAPTVCENIANWQRFSRFGIEVVNIWPGRDGANLHLPATLDLTRYTGIIIHSTVAYSPVNLAALDQQLERPFEEFDGLKILMKQDEQVQTNRFAEYIGNKKIDIVITCVSPEELEKVYPRRVVGNVDFVHAYTGYISASLRRLSPRAMSERHIDVSYRGSTQPLEFGRLGYEKRSIGDDVANAAPNPPNLRIDISSRWEHRINGGAWFDFLGHSKVVLGAESGSNLFDFTGEVASWCRAYEQRHAHRDPYAKEFYFDAHAEFLHTFEGNVNYATISPRHFEAAASHAAQFLYEGKYSGVFLPYRHFFPLKRDLSNIEEAFDFARDDKRLQELADCAYEEIVGNPSYHYEHFVEMFDRAVEQRRQRKQRPLSNNGYVSTEPNKGRLAKALLLIAHEPTLDPRIDWFAEGLANDFEVCELGISTRGTTATAAIFERLSASRTRVRIDGQRIRWDFITPQEAIGKVSLGIDAMRMLFFTAQLPFRSLSKAIGALDATEEDLNRFRDLCDYFLKVNSSLLDASRRIGGFDFIVAVDLDTLPAAVALAEEHGVPLVYDAHEYWPYAFPEFRHWEIEFWSEMEKKLLKRVTLPLTVSPHLADIMSQQYDCTFDCLPNCAPLGSEKAVDLESALALRAQSEDVIFLVQGIFSRDRGFDKLINVWDRVDPRARLWLRGPDSPHKTAMVELAQSKGLMGRSVFFPDAVAATDLIMAARGADIGLVPYEPTGLNNRYCSPNKLSQYMAAGLPVICNDLDFVKSIVVNNGVGAAVDFRNERALVRTINEYVFKRDSIPALSRKSQDLFKASFNWQAQSQKVYGAIKKVLCKNEPNERDFDFAWIAASEYGRTTGDLSTYESQIIASDTRNKQLSNEVQQLNTVYLAEIERLNKVYTEEIMRLQSFPAVGRRILNYINRRARVE